MPSRSTAAQDIRAPCADAATSPRAPPGGPGRSVAGRGGHRLELAPQVADLVAQLRRVLEAPLLGRRQHLLLQPHHRLLDLRWLHVDALLAAPAAALGRLLGVAEQ